MIKLHITFKPLCNYINMMRASIFYRRNIVKAYDNIDRSQYFPAPEIRKLQLRLLNDLLMSSDLTWYSNKMNGPVTIDKILDHSIGLSKNELRDEFEKLYKPAKKVFIHVTSGSTGRPLKVISSNISEAQRAAQRMRFYSWWGITPWDRNILIWGKMSTENAERKSIKKRMKDIALEPRRLFINVFDLNEATIGDYYQQSLEKKAVFIRGYASGVYQFCSLMQKNGLDGKKLGIKLAIVTSEILLEDHRNFIEQILDCKVANEYGAAEIGLFACECPAGSMHINEELNLLQTDEEGNLLVTDLHNTSTPLLNYAIGDRIIISDKLCSCGRGLRVIDKIVGREGDLVRKANGEFASQYVFYYAAKEIAAMGFPDSIAQYKVIQEGMRFTVFIVKGPNFKAEAVGLFSERIRQNIGKEISVNIEFVNEIPKEKSGKIRFFQRLDS
ncbi:MAG: phenylacetate--CoA ligase family protein [Desulfobacterales bacterium]|nr:phenylacetate--CoA ligase family protein [Desulfobacterales bacterium]